MKGDNCISTDLNSRPKDDKNINQNKMILVKIFRGIIVPTKDTTNTVVLLGPSATTNKILEV